MAAKTYTDRNEIVIEADTYPEIEAAFEPLKADGWFIWILEPWRKSKPRYRARLLNERGRRPNA